jgi:hypothetical protein
MNAELADELESLAAIYSDHALAVDGGDAGGSTTVTVHVPRGDDGAGDAVAASFVLPPGYPSCGPPPTVELEGLPRGMREPLLARLGALMSAHAGEPLLFPAIEAIRETLAALAEAAAAGEEEAARARAAAAAARQAASFYAADPAAARGITIAHGAPVVVQKSTFIAHVARVRSREDVESVLAELYQDGRIARATHNMRAYRFRDAASGATVADNDDDGEDAAGGRLAVLLEVMKAEDVLVVVTRWYGGVLLGPLRFKVINDTARQLIEAQLWYAGRGGSGGGGSGGGGRDARQGGHGH